MSSQNPYGHTPVSPQQQPRSPCLHSSRQNGRSKLLRSNSDYLGEGIFTRRKIFPYPLGQVLFAGTSITCRIETAHPFFALDGACAATPAGVFGTLPGDSVGRTQPQPLTLWRSLARKPQNRAARPADSGLRIYAGGRGASLSRGR